MAAAREPATNRPAGTAVGSVRLLSSVTICAVAVIDAAVWLGAVFANVVPADALPAWLRGVAGTPLVLAVPALVIPAIFVLLAWPRRARPTQHARSLYSAQALALVVVALPALFPFSLSLATGSGNGGAMLILLISFITTALRVPGLSLGVALAMVDPLVVRRARGVGPRGPSPRALAGITFGTIVLAAGILATALIPSQCTLGLDTGQACVLANTQLPMIYPAVLASYFAVSAMLGVWLGYALGASLAQVDR